MELFVLWILFGILVGAFASVRGRSAVGWFLVSIVLTPLFAGILLGVLPNQAVEQERHRELLAAAAAKPPDAIEGLERLADLRDRGAITPQEFEAKKSELL